MSAITSPYFTDELAAFLKEKGVLEKAEVYAGLDDIRTGTDIEIRQHYPFKQLCNAFYFELTKEGYHYWNDMDNEHEKSLKP